jgi:hypothetical protein
MWVVPVPQTEGVNQILRRGRFILKTILTFVSGRKRQSRPAQVI